MNIYSSPVNGRFMIFRRDDKNILFDVESNAVCTIAEGKSDVLNAVIETLEDQEKDCNYSTLVSNSYEDGAYLAINLNLTHLCNLKCVYCFAQGGDYGTLSDVMGEDCLPVIKQLIDTYKGKKDKVRFEFFGGEPLLNFEMIKRVVLFSQEIKENENIEFIYRISTNMTYVTEEMAEFLAKYNFVVSISIDGCKCVQNELRPFKNGDGSFDVIMNNIKKIRSLNDNLTIVARMTLASKAVRIIDNIKELIQTNLFDYVSMYPASVIDENGKYRYFFDDEIQEQLEEVIKNYATLYSESKRFKGVLEYEKILDEIVSHKISISHCSAGGIYYTLSNDKTITPCHRLCGKKEFEIDLNDGKESSICKEWSKKVNEKPECQTCWVRYICGGGCKQENLESRGNIMLPYFDNCSYAKFIISRLIENMVDYPKEITFRKRELDDLFIYCGRATVINPFKVDVYKEKFRNKDTEFYNI